MIYIVLLFRDHNQTVMMLLIKFSIGTSVKRIKVVHIENEWICIALYNMWHSYESGIQQIAYLM